MRIGKIAAGLVACAVACGSVWGGDFDLQHAEFAKYYRAITGTDAPEGIVKFAIDPKISQSGRDAYAITSGWRASPPALVTITGSNLRSVWYGLYDLLERRGGCRWFWDGDVVPKRHGIDLAGLDVVEEARFEYRGLRYFAHRGLTRFQAEHWGPDEWRREIDWILKRRLNVFMLRIGQDDLFQRSFPDTCAYPDPAKPLPGRGEGYDDRSLFWSLEYRGRLRRRIQQYAFARGLMAPEDFGTMTHWYARTPEDFLEKKKPDFLPQSNNWYTERNGFVWDIRMEKWVDEYWKMTKTAVEAYGEGAEKQRLLHTIGLGERMCYHDRKRNFDLKVFALDKFLALAHRDYPNAKVLIAGWDFYHNWEPQEVRDFLPHLDPKRDIVWDYEADIRPGAYNSHNYFAKWDLVGKFPYTYSIFLGLEAALDARADYPLIEERQRLVQNDPFCKGYIFWPESSHTDPLCLRFFTANAWSHKALLHGEVLDEFCASRYGANADAMKKAWKAVLPAARLRDWEKNYSYAALGVGGDVALKETAERIALWKKPAEEALSAFGLLAEVPWRDPFVQRDSIDIVRMAMDRLIALRIWEFGLDFTLWRKGRREGGDLPGKARRLAALCDKMADFLAMHTDYSLWESYKRLDAVEKIANPDFPKTLFENASCPYCRSHQYELARHWYARHVAAVAENVARLVAAGDRATMAVVDAEKERRTLKAKPLESLRPALARTEENFRQLLRDAAEFFPPVNQGTQENR